MKSLLTKESIIELYDKNKNLIKMLDDFFDKKSTIFNSMYQREESKILYMMMREILPQTILEMSPHRGWTTIHIELALLGHKHKMYSFEIKPELCVFLKGVLKEYKLDNNVEVIEGDVMETFDGVVNKLKDPIDFMLIDHGHYTELNDWYLKTVFDYLKPGGYALIHDLHAPSSNQNPRKHIDECKHPQSYDFTETIQFLGWWDVNKDNYEHLLITDLIEDQDYLEKVKPYGGGDLKPAPREPQTAIQANPTLWLRKIK